MFSCLRVRIADVAHAQIRGAVDLAMAAHDSAHSRHCGGLFACEIATLLLVVGLDVGELFGILIKINTIRLILSGNEIRRRWFFEEIWSRSPPYDHLSVVQGHVVLALRTFVGGFEALTLWIRRGTLLMIIVLILLHLLVHVVVLVLLLLL